MPDSAHEPPADVLDTGRAGSLVMRGAVLRLGGFVAGGVLSAGSAILLTRHLGKVGFGQYATIIAVATLVVQLTEGGLTGLATRDYALASAQRKAQLIGDRLGLQIATTGLAILLSGLFALLAGYDATRIWATLAAALGVGLAMLQMTVSVPLIAALRFGATSALELVRQGILVALTILLVLVGAGLLPLLSAIIPSSFAVLVATWVMAARTIDLTPTFDPRAWRELVRPALVLSLSSGVATLYVFTTQILTSLAASPAQTGIFAASLRVFGVIVSIPGLLVASALPLLARAARDDAARLELAMQGLFEVALIAGVGVGLILVVGAAPIIAVVGGQGYSSAVGPLRIEGAAVLGTCLTPVWSTGLLSLHRHSAQLVCNVASLLVTAGLTLALAPALGARGSALATVAGEWTVALALLVALARAKRDLLPRAWLILPRVGLAAVAAFAVMLIPIPDIFRLALALAIYPTMIVLVRALPKELLELLPERLSWIPSS